MVKLALFAALLTFTKLLYGSAISFQTGATSVGAGGPNSMGIPPRPTDLGISYITDKHLTLNLNLMGISLGKREFIAWGSFVELGGGIIIGGNGVGLGPYSVFGYEFFRAGDSYGFSLEYSQSVGITFTGRIISPYIIRLGFSKWF